MSTTPNWTAVPRLGFAVPVIDADRTSAIVAVTTLLIGVANGTRISRVDFQHIVTNTACVVRLWWVSSGVKTLIRELALTPVTATTSVPGALVTISFEPWGLILPSVNDILACSCSANTFNAIAHGGDL